MTVLWVILVLVIAATVVGAVWLLVAFKVELWRQDDPSNDDPPRT